jgi:hypothetical protein
MNGINGCDKSIVDGPSRPAIYLQILSQIGRKKIDCRFFQHVNLGYCRKIFQHENNKINNNCARDQSKRHAVSEFYEIKLI